MKRAIWTVIALGMIAAAGIWWLSSPTPVPAVTLAGALDGHKPDLANGERLFHVGGCASCHAAKGAKGPDRLKLGGGQALATPFGTFRVPNISPDAGTGIGSWSLGDIVNAVMTGTSPDGRNYYPAFPYTSYARLRLDDAIDLAGYLKTLPAVTNTVAGHTIPFPFNIRRAIGLWKRLYLSSKPVVALTDRSDAATRGQYLVEGAAHCGECHTPRNVIGGADLARWLAGAPVLDGAPAQAGNGQPAAGHVPDITPDPAALGPWSAGDIAYYLESGFTPDGDSVGGAMAEVQENMALLPASDRADIAAYLKAIPPLRPAPKPATP